MYIGEVFFVELHCSRLLNTEDSTWRRFFGCFPGCFSGWSFLSWSVMTQNLDLSFSAAWLSALWEWFCLSGRDLHYELKTLVFKQNGQFINLQLYFSSCRQATWRAQVYTGICNCEYKHPIVLTNCGVRFMIWMFRDANKGSLITWYPLTQQVKTFRIMDRFTCICNSKYNFCLWKLLFFFAA